MSETPLDGRFVSTCWSVVARAGGADDVGARSALTWLVERYWDPLRAHLRRRGLNSQDAQDLVQDLFVRLLERRDLAQADPTRGRFRSWLLACLDHLLADARERAAAQKRGGGARHLELTAATEAPAAGEDPVRAFDRDWAVTVLARARERLQREAATPAARERGEALALFLVRNADAGEYAELAAQLGLEAGAVRVAVHRQRTRFRELLREEVAGTLLDPTRPGAVDEEISDLLRALA